MLVFSRFSTDKIRANGWTSKFFSPIFFFNSGGIRNCHRQRNMLPSWHLRIHLGVAVGGGRWCSACDINRLADESFFFSNLFFFFFRPIGQVRLTGGLARADGLGCKSLYSHVAKTRWASIWVCSFWFCIITSLVIFIDRALLNEYDDVANYFTGNTFHRLIFYNTWYFARTLSMAVEVFNSSFLLVLLLALSTVLCVFVDRREPIIDFNRLIRYSL